MNLSQAHYTLIQEKKPKKSIPISINSNPFPFQYIFNNKKQNLAISYITMGNKIQKIQKNKNSNILSVSKKNTTQTIGNKNLITESHISKYSVNSLISKSSLINQNFNSQLKISTYKIIKNINKTSDYSSLLSRSKNIKNNDQKKLANISINTIIKSNSMLKDNSKINKKPNLKSNIRNFNSKNTKDFITGSFLTLNHNYLNVKEEKNIELTLNNGKNKVQKKLIKNNKYLFNPFQKQIDNIKNNKKILVSSFINNNIKDKKNNNKLDKTNNTNNKKIISKASTQCKTNKTITTSNKNNLNSNFRNIRNKTISINLNKILNDIQIEKKNYKRKIKRNEINLNKRNTSSSLLEIIEKNIEKENSHILIKENNEEKKNNSLNSFLSKLTDEKNIINNNNSQDNNKSYQNNLFNENNLYEIPDNYNDKFDNLHSIVKKIPFNKVLINCGNFFSITNKRYDTYINEFIKKYSN